MRVLPAISGLLLVGLGCLVGCFVDTGLPGPVTDPTGDGSTTDPTTGAPAVCGDGMQAAAELCDDGELNGLYAPCGPLCLPNYCGDGLLGPSETCDDGNTFDGDTCRSDCTPARCGDLIVQDGETCDDGNSDENDGCTSRCGPPGCGDGVVSEGEGCDLGPANADTGHCTTTCQPRSCGDGFVQPGEACDPPMGDCGADCRWTTCGDGMAQAGEQCEGVSDTCTDFCTAPQCGDGFVSVGEGCDDGNRQDGDDCDASCQVSICGDGIVASDERCDDKDPELGDGCTPECERDARFVFVSSGTFQAGALGGLQGADDHCQSLAEKAGLLGRYRAWLGDADASPATRFTKSDLPYILPASQLGTGILVAEDWVDLVDGALLHPIQVTEKGELLLVGESCVSADVLAWTHTSATAGPPGSDGDCGGWKFNTGVGDAGLVNNAGPGWTEGCAQVSCAKPLHIYCVEQG
jgi:cysteine-rich repeat protein